MTWRTDPGVLVSSGEFLIDQSERKRKLKMERGKLWRHRAGVVWNELRWPAILLITPIACALTMFFTNGDMPPGLRAAVGFIGAFVGILLNMGMRVAWDDFLSGPAHKIARKWNP